MTRIAQRLLMPVVSAFLTCVAAAPVWSDVIGTGNYSFDVDMTNGHINGSLAYNDATETVFGTPVNLSTAGTVNFTGQAMPTTPANITGTFALHSVASPCTLCDAACNFCEAACPLCYNISGNYVTGQASLTANVTNLTGTVVAGLPPGLSYTVDTTAATSSTMGSITHDTGTAAFNAFQGVATPPGANQTVITDTKFVDSNTQEVTTLEVDVTFTNVNSPGTTTVTGFAAPSILLPPDISADVGQCSKTKSLGCQINANCPSGETCKAYHAFSFDVLTTANITPPITVCSHYPDKEKKPPGGNGFIDNTGKPGLPEKGLRLFHNEGGTFKDVTSIGYPDTLNNVVCGQVNSLSAFGMYVPTDMPGGSNPATDCVTEWSLCSNAAVGGTSGGGGTGTGPKTSATTLLPVPKPILTCSASDPTCEGPTPNACTFCVRVCPNVKDGRLACTPTDVAQYSLTKLVPGSSSIDNTNFNNVLTALQRLGGGTINANQVIYNPALASGLKCTDPITLVVPLPSGKKSVTKAVGLSARTSTGLVDANKLSLLCNQ